MLALLLAWSGNPALAQETTPIAPEALLGERVRVRIVAGLEPLVGTVVQRDGDLLVVQDAVGATSTFDPRRVESIERSLGQRRRTGRGFLIGAGVGALAGGVAGYLYENAICGSSSCDSDPVPAMAAGSVVFAFGGGLVGALLGATMRSDRWAPVTVLPGTDAGVHLGLDAARGFGLTITFPLGRR